MHVVSRIESGLRNATCFVQFGWPALSRLARASAGASMRTSAYALNAALNGQGELSMHSYPRRGARERPLSHRVNRQEKASPGNFSSGSAPVKSFSMNDRLASAKLETVRTFQGKRHAMAEDITSRCSVLENRLRLRSDYRYRIRLVMLINAHVHRKLTTIDDL